MASGMATRRDFTPLSESRLVKARRAGVGERDLVRLLERCLGQGGRRPAELEVGIGDDAAVFRLGGTRLVWTVDACVEGVHFDRRWVSCQDVGWRSLQAAASDLAAMGARPLGALGSLVLPAWITRAEVRELARGQAAAARSLGCPVVGGNLSRGSELGVTTSVLGVCRRPLLRSGARPGDELWLVGEVGLARAGWELLRRGMASSGSHENRCISAWRRPRALVARGVELGRVAQAAIDLSDGLGGDARQLAEASRVRVVLERGRLERVLPQAVRCVGERLGLDVFALALGGGEDYALLAAGTRRPAWARVIGRVEKGRGAVLEAPDGSREELGPGFDHFG
jgi:thiamine-monophosphate kinase